MDYVGFPGIILVLPGQFSITLDIRSVQPPALGLPPRVHLCSGIYDAGVLVHVREFLHRYLLGWPFELSWRTNPEVKLDWGPFVHRLLMRINILVFLRPRDPISSDVSRANRM